MHLTVYSIDTEFIFVIKKETNNTRGIEPQCSKSSINANKCKEYDELHVFSVLILVWNAWPLLSFQLINFLIKNQHAYMSKCTYCILKQISKSFILDIIIVNRYSIS